MKLCFPVETDNGINSILFGHFGSTPIFMVVDTNSMDCQAVNNSNQQHAHGACNPVQAIGGLGIDGIVVTGIGPPALMRLQQAGLKVYQGIEASIKDNVAQFKAGALPEFTAQDCCGGHGQGGGCQD
ncbi:NifB/NifX family molybdenum-iron cluster-binding protein [Planctomycetota bacterium]